MSRLLSLGLTVLALLLAAVGVAIFAAARARSVTDVPVATGNRAAAMQSAVPSDGAASTTGPSRPRSGRTIGLDEAIKELDLIKPSRPKLADDFALKTPDGKAFRLRDQQGKPIFVNFWATWCAPCREEMPAMERLYRQHTSDGFVVIAVSVDADPAVVPPFLKEHGLTFPVVVDPKMEAANAYGVRALPSSFIIDRTGQLRALALGPRAWDGEAAHSLVEGLLR